MKLRALLGVLLFSLCSMAHGYGVVIHHGLYIKGGLTTWPERSSILDTGLNKLSLKSEPFSGPSLTLGYTYYPEDIHWLGLLAELSYFKQAGPVNSETVPYSLFIVNNGFRVTQVPLRKDYSIKAQGVAVNLGPKVAWLAKNGERPWTSSHLFFSGGLTLCSKQEEETLKLTILDPRITFASTNSPEITATGMERKTSISGFFTTGGTVKLTDAWSWTLEWNHNFGLGTSTVQSGLAMTFF